MRDQRQGRPFTGVFSSADASALSETNSRFTLYSAANTPAAITLTANERCVITDIDVVVGASSLTVTLYDGADNTPGNGEQISKGNFAANGGISSHLVVPHYGTQATYPKVKTSGA